MSAEIVSLEDWRVTRNSRAALAHWANRLRSQIKVAVDRGQDHVTEAIYNQLPEATEGASERPAQRKDQKPE